MSVKARNFIDGQESDAAGGRTLENFEPATGRAYGTVADSSAEDVSRAVEAARRAFPRWAALTPGERARRLRAIADWIRANAAELARAESIDSGKPLRVAAEVDIPRAALNFEFFADAATQFSSESHRSDPRTLNVTLRDPLGVVGCISPWNLPLYLLTWKVAPALAAGCCVVAKPSELTPVTASWLARACRETGLPPGALNVVHGRGAEAGAALVAHPDVRAISFTGSTATGASIARVAAPAFRKLSLEMGGKNATVVFADSDLELAAREALRAAFSNQGQICLCGSRILIERPVYDRFRDALVAGSQALRVGDPLEEGTEQGALVSGGHREKVLGAIEAARREGGRILCGGGAARVGGRCSSGWFVEPTLIDGLGPRCAANQEEIFGPVATLLPFGSVEPGGLRAEAEALELANGTRYGLAASVFTRDLDRAHRVSAGLRTGLVWVNCWMARDLRVPFGGAKDSGVGREGGWEAMRFFTEPKNVTFRIGGVE